MESGVVWSLFTHTLYPETTFKEWQHFSGAAYRFASQQLGNQCTEWQHQPSLCYSPFSFINLIDRCNPLHCRLQNSRILIARTCFRSIGNNIVSVHNLLCGNLSWIALTPSSPPKIRISVTAQCGIPREFLNCRYRSQLQLILPAELHHHRIVACRS